MERKMNESRVNPEAEFTSLDLKRKLLVVVADVLILAELCVAMYFAHAAGDDFTPTFMKVFLGLAVPTLIAALLITRAMRQPPQAEAVVPVESSVQTGS
jgi:hypothetical protein